MDYKKYVDVSYDYLFLIFWLIIPFEEYISAVPNIIVGLLICGYLLNFKKENCKRIFSYSSYKSWLLLTVYIVLISIFYNRLDQDFFVIKKLLIPGIILLLGFNIKNFNKCKIWFVVGTTLSVLISFFGILKYWYSNNNFSFSSGDFINQILVSERIYIGFCSVISVIFLIEFIKRCSNYKIKLLSSLLIIFLVSFSFLIVARIAILCLIVVFLILLLSIKSSKWKLGGLFTLIAFIVVFFVLNKNLSQRFFHINDKYKESYIDKIKNQEPRFLIWNCSLDIFHKDFNMLYGNGFYNVKNQLVECYESTITINKKRNWYVERGFNTHNEYIDFLMSSGFIGVILFVSVIFFMFTNSRNNFFSLSLIGSIILILSIENIFHRQIGCYLFSLLWLSLLKNKKVSISESKDI